jgi:hypothetical protein
MDLLDILFTSFHGLARYPLYIISWTFSIFSLHYFMYLLDILFTSFRKSMKWCKDDIAQVQEMMVRGYRVSPWNNVKRISSKSMKWSKEDIEQIHNSWTCSISSLHHFMDLLDILFTTFHGLARYPLYIILASPWNDVKMISRKSMKWWKEDIE